MKSYSIVRVGNDYVVKVDNISVMKCASRRRAAQLVVDACGLLDKSAADELRQSSINRECCEVS